MDQLAPTDSDRILGGMLEIADFGGMADSELPISEKSAYGKSAYGKSGYGFDDTFANGHSPMTVLRKAH